MRIGNFLLSVAFSPRSHTSGKDHQSAPNGHSYSWYMIATARKASFLLLLAGITAVAVMLLLQPGQMYTDFPSWRNVTMLQIIKMHLSPRPSQVNRKVVCPNPMPKPGIFLSQMDTSKISFNEKARERLKNLASDEQWKNVFAPSLSKEEKLDLLHLYGVFQQALDSAGLGHIVLHGSALGAWRFHGVTPWDDDIDLGIDAADWAEVKQALSCIEGFTLVTTSNTKWYFFRNNGTFIRGDDTTKRWPFLDVFLYSKDNRYVFGLNYVHLRKFTFRIEDMFPTQLVPFDGFMVPVPGHLRNVLEHQFVNPTVCVSQHLNHRNGTPLGVIKVPCEELSDLYTIMVDIALLHSASQAHSIQASLKSTSVSNRPPHSLASIEIITMPTTHPLLRGTSTSRISSSE
ncbi:hypothetical protein RRG08_060059 [Elysia crispata]|uniref:LicD/FKTN/FKRP nucleotidyltransferase domain-containing protein n=1 Tax=Elysia crispata TaxID=231223 RepID=A0AAE0Y0M7_9GAST|nr:hypothetical protein RRG08_060059 [Elysia crispata]